MSDKGDQAAGFLNSEVAAQSCETADGKIQAGGNRRRTGEVTAEVFTQRIADGLDTGGNEETRRTGWAARNLLHHQLQFAGRLNNIEIEVQNLTKKIHICSQKLSRELEGL